MSQSVEFSEGGAPFEGLSFLTLKSPALRARADVTFYIPPDAINLRDVPLILLLHGAYGSHWNWSVNGAAHRTAQRLINEKALAPSVLAMPSDGLWGDSSAYLKHPDQDFEKWILEDVPAGARTVAPCVTAQSPIFLCGLSIGGFGAMRIGAKHPGYCRGISAHSSVTHFDQIMRYVEEPASAFGAPPEDHGVLETMARNRGTLPPLRFDCGDQDPLVKHNRQLHRDLEAEGIPHQYEEFSGRHDWAYWKTHVEKSLRFFGQILAGKKTI